MLSRKEMMIVFLYDTEICSKEEDDPLNPVLFFAPSWVDDLQKLALVGQIMGVSKFFLDNFEKPKALNLQHGKFALQFFGRYVLVVGSDRNISDNILFHRSNLLSSLIRLYHHSIGKISASFTANENQRKHMIERLHDIVDSYLLILQYHEGIFHNIMLASLPKSAGNIFLEIEHILQSCQYEQGVLGGQILYNNKVVVSHLGIDLSKLLVISEPLNLKNVNHVNVDFHIPFGVQLISIYISIEEYNNLQKKAMKSQTSFSNTNPNLLPFTLRKKSINKENQASYSKSIMFSNIPEDENLLSSQKIKNRPTYLPLKFKNMTSKEVPESGISSINFDEFSDSFPDFIGRTSVLQCSTPMTENKILQGNILSICSNTCEEHEKIDLKVEKMKSVDKKYEKVKQKVTGTPRKIKLIPKVSAVIDIDKQFEKMPTKINHPIDSFNYISNLYNNQNRRHSWVAMDKIMQSNENITYKNNQTDEEQNTEIEFMRNCKIKRSKSISDPIFPIFYANGYPISIYLFEEYLELYYTNLSLKDNIGKNEHDKNDRIGRAIETKFMFPIGIKCLTKKNKEQFSLQLNQPDSIPNKNVVLTPLMTKLTEIGSQCEFLDLKKNNFNKLLPSQTNIDAKSNLSDNNIKHMNLFVCEQNNMTIMLLLEENVVKNSQLIQTLFDICVSKLSKIETQLHKVLNINTEEIHKSCESSYSFILADNDKWNMIRKIGPWAPKELLTAEDMHSNMSSKYNLSEMVLKIDENVLYGYRIGDIEVFYQQSYNNTSFTTIPPPSDLFGSVASISKRRLERDFGIVLL